MGLLSPTLTVALLFTTLLGVNVMLISSCSMLGLGICLLEKLAISLVGAARPEEASPLESLDWLVISLSDSSNLFDSMMLWPDTALAFG